MNQSRQVWNSLTNYFLCPVSFLTLSWKFHEDLLTRFSMILLTNADPGNRKIDPGLKELIATPRKCSRLLLVWMPFFAEEIHENPLKRFPAMLLKGTHSPEKIFICSRGKLNILPRSIMFLVPSPPYHVSRVLTRARDKNISVVDPYGIDTVMWYMWAGSILSS